jgi:signal transduction histidine kinase
MTTVLRISNGESTRGEVADAVRDAGFGLVEVEDWEAAEDALRKVDAAVVLCDGELLEGVDADTLRKTFGALGAANKAAALAPDMARALSHELRTPLSAMAGWLHLMETGRLDEDGMKRAIQKLRGNIDDQVRMIERYLGSTSTRSNA